VRIIVLAALATRLAAQDTTAALVERAAHEYRAAKTVRATFEQTLTSPATGGVHPAHGEYFQSGSRFALRFTDPVGDAVVSDGSTLWLYLPSSVKGQVMKMPSQAGAGLDVLTQLLSSPKDSYVAKRLRDDTVDGHAATVFLLTAKKKDFPFTRATLWIGKSDALVWQLETTEDTGMLRRVRFTSVQTDVELPANAFVFNVPQGVRIIDSESLMGKKP
jgi:outer membrane lipoprotein-sorting protein